MHGNIVSFCCAFFFIVFSICQAFAPIFIFCFCYQRIGFHPRRVQSGSLKHGNMGEMVHAFFHSFSHNFVVKLVVAFDVTVVVVVAVVVNTLDVCYSTDYLH